MGFFDQLENKISSTFRETGNKGSDFFYSTFVAPVQGRIDKKFQDLMQKLGIKPLEAMPVVVEQTTPKDLLQSSMEYLRAFNSNLPESAKGNDTFKNRMGELEKTYNNASNAPQSQKAFGEYCVKAWEMEVSYHRAWEKHAEAMVAQNGPDAAQWKQFMEHAKSRAEDALKHQIINENILYPEVQRKNVPTPQNPNGPEVTYAELELPNKKIMTDAKRQNLANRPLPEPPKHTEHVYAEPCSTGAYTKTNIYDKASPRYDRAMQEKYTPDPIYDLASPKENPVTPKQKRPETIQDAISNLKTVEKPKDWPSSSPSPSSVAGTLQKQNPPAQQSSAANKGGPSTTPGSKVQSQSHVTGKKASGRLID